MGIYDTVWFKNNQQEDVGIQFKVGDVCLHEFEIGDSVDIGDGIYFEYDSCFVVYGGTIVAAFSKDDHQMFNKWGRNISYPEIQ